MEKYPYQPLSSKLRQIRLLHLLSKWAGSTTTGGKPDEIWKDNSSDSSTRVLCDESNDKVRDNDGQLTKQAKSLQPCLGKLETVSMESELRYTALSYVWGDSSNRVPFILDNNCLLTTRNLALALQALQLDDEPFVLWADAMCINQDDPKEKSEQVHKMKEIYASASLVIVWLGAATPGTDVAMDIFNPFEEHGASLDMAASYTYRSYDKQRQDLVERSQLFKNFLESDSIPSMFVAVQPLLIRECWYRAWVLQEFCIGREVFFACGSKKMSLALFDNVIMTLDVINNLSSVHVHQATAQWFTASNQDQLKLFSEKAGTRDVKHATDFLRQRLYHQHGLEEKRSLLDLLVTVYVNVRPRAILRSTDPRDKIYCFLGIASDAEQLKIVPDYTKSITEVYTEAATQILSLGRLELLQYVHPQNPNLPSWVPDWEQAIRHITPYECRELDKHFSADATMPAFHPRQIFGDPSILECLGYTVDSVLSFSDFFTDDTTKALLAVVEMSPSDDETLGKLDVLIRVYVHFSQIKQLCQRSTQINPSLYGPSNTWLKEALWRIPVADQEVVGAQSPNFQRATSESGRRYKGLLNIIKAWESLGARPKDPDLRARTAFFKKNVAPNIVGNSAFYGLYSPAVGRTVSRRPYLTQKGYVGLGHEGMRIGDLVCILQGGPVLFLLRKTEKG